MRILHVVPSPGRLTQEWIESQIGSPNIDDEHLWSIGPPATDYEWHRRPERQIPLGRRSWIPGDERPVDRRELARLLSPYESMTLVHAHFGPASYWTSQALTHWHGGFVVSFYGYDATTRRYTTWPWTARYRRLFRRANLVLAEGPRMAERLEALGARPDTIQVLRLPVRRPKTVRVEPTCDVLMAGRLVPKKGFATGIRAFSEAFNPGEARLRIIGDGPLRHDLEALVHDLGRTSDVDFVPSVPIDTFHVHLQQTRVCVFPSETAANGDGEGGAPVTIPLVQSLGVAVIASDHDDLPWIVAPDTPVVSAGDPEALAEQLRALVEAVRAGDPDLEEHKLRAARYVKERHDPAILTAQRRELYRRVLATLPRQP